MTTAIDYLTELNWRGMLHPSATDGAPLDAALKAGAVVGYCGFDPTADSLHVGSLLPLMGLVHLQRSNNHPVALIGGGTGLIGDPSGKSSERPLADRDAIEENARKIRLQIEPFLADGPYTVTDNADWLGQLNLIEFLRDVGKFFSVNVMLQRESVRSRMEVGISFTEFSYMLLQAYDYLKLHQIHGVNLQLGGSDQWGNIAAGVDLVRRMTSDAVHGLTFHLITTASGTKFGKTEAGAVWLDPAKTSPYQFYQFWINVDDRDVGRYLRLFTLLDRDAIDALERDSAEHPERRDAQRCLARDVTTRVHRAAAAGSAERMSAVLFGADPHDLTCDDLVALSREIPYVTVRQEEIDFAVNVGVVPPTLPLEYRVDVVELTSRKGIVASKGEARRLIQQGGLYVNDRRVTPDAPMITEADRLCGRYVILRKGARSRTLIELV